MIDYARTSREHQLRRIAGASGEARRRVGTATANAEWTGVCRVCGTPVAGTMALLREGCPVCNQIKDKK